MQSPILYMNNYDYTHGTAGSVNVMRVDGQPRRAVEARLPIHHTRCGMRAHSNRAAVRTQSEYVCRSTQC